MSIGTPNGILDITGATLRVSKMEFRQSTGFDTVLNNVARNTMLLMDETEQTTSNSWALKLPNAWVAEFHGYWESGSSGAPILFNFYNDSTSGTNGYTLSMDDTAISINYDGGSALGSATLSSTLNNDTYRKVAVIFERSVLDVSIDGEHVFHFADSQLRDRVYDNNSGYVTFTHSSTDERKLKNLKFTNGDKWIREIDSSNIAYVGGNVGIGTTIPGTKLDVSGTVRGTHLIGDGSAISSIQSSNVSDFGSNVTRITTLETDLDNNSARITTVSTDLSDNSSRITALESGDISISGDKTFTGDIIFESNVHMNGGNVFVANTVNLTVTDPIIELGSNNSGTNDLGIIMTRNSATKSNIALIFDESDDTLRMGYTLNGASDSVVDLDSNALAVNVQGELTVGSNLEVGTANLFVDTSTSRVGINVASPSYTLDVGGDVNLSTGSTLRINGTPAVFSNWTINGSDIYRSSGNVAIGTTTPDAVLDVNGLKTKFKYEYRYQDLWTSNNNQTFTIPVTGGNARGLMLVEAKVIQVAANSSGARVARVKGMISNYHTGNYYMTVIEGENVSAFETYMVGTSGSAAGTFTMKYQPEAGYQQDVVCRLYLKIWYGGYTSTLGALSRTDTGSNTALTAPTWDDAVTSFGGSVGIGTNSTTSKLELAANGGGSIITLKRTNASNGGSKGGLRFTENTNGYNVGVIACLGDGANTSGALCFYTAASSTDSNVYLPTTNERMRISSSGNVGIGVASPGARLDVQFTGDDGIRAKNSGSSHASVYIDSGSGYSYLRFQGSGADKFWLQATPSGDLAFRPSGGGHVMDVKNNGNVGIGSSSPSQKLDVNGVIKSKNPTWSVYKGSTGGNNSGIIQYNSERCTRVNVTLNTTVVSGSTYFYRATITVAGRYFVGFQGFGDPNQSGVGAGVEVYVNGSRSVRNYTQAPNSNYFAIGGLGVILDLVVNDYVEINSAATLHHNHNCSFYGFMIG